MKNEIDLVRDFLEQNNLKYKYDQEREIFRAIFASKAIEESIKLSIEVDTNLNIVKFTVFPNGLLIKHKGMHKKINSINRNLELGKLFLMPIKEHEEYYKVFFQYTFMVAGNDVLMNTKQFLLLISYIVFTQQIIKIDFEGYIEIE